MDRPEVLKTRAILEAQQKFNCAHEQTEFRKRIVAGGGIQRVYQCLKCGAAKSRALSREDSLAITGGTEPPAFDESLIDSWNSARRQAFAEIDEQFGHFGKPQQPGETKISDWWPRYQAYLLTPEWLEKKRKVILRAQGICEGCRDAPATTAHHITYAHVTQEFLFELLALCEACHKRVHGES